MHLYSFVFVEHQEEGLTDFMVRKHMSTVQYPLNTAYRLFLAEHVSSCYFVRIELYLNTSDMSLPETLLLHIYCEGLNFLKL